MVHYNVLREVYLRVLDDSLTSARARVGDDDECAERIRGEFTARVPQELPEGLSDAADDPGLRDRLTKRAARELYEVCESVTHPRGEFVQEVARKANDIGDDR